MVGPVKELPSERSAWLAVEALNLNINRNFSEHSRAPQTVMDLIRHYESTELALDSVTVAYSTKHVYKAHLKNLIEPRWGALILEALEDICPACTWSID